MKHYVPFCGPGDYLGDLFSPWMTGVQKDSQPVQAHEGLCSHQSLTSDWPKKSYGQVHTMGQEVCLAGGQVSKLLHKLLWK